jgi:hypothetical protein
MASQHRIIKEGSKLSSALNLYIAEKDLSLLQNYHLDKDEDKFLAMFRTVLFESIQHFHVTKISGSSKYVFFFWRSTSGEGSGYEIPFSTIKRSVLHIVLLDLWSQPLSPVFSGFRLEVTASMLLLLVYSCS